MSKSKKKSLGRGLDALLGGADTVILTEEQEDSVPVHQTQPIKQEVGISRETLKQIPIERIKRGTYQPRRQFDKEALQELADSLKSQGMIQPIVLRPRGDGYELIAGERRWRAAQLAGMAEIPAIIREYADADAAAVSLIENIQRENLNPLEEATALQRLQAEFGMSHQAVADAVGRSRAAVSNLLRLLELHDEVKAMVDARELDMGHARALLGAAWEQQPLLARQVRDKGLSVRAVEALVKKSRQHKESGSGVPAGPAAKDPDILALESRLGNKLGSSVQVRHKSNGSGKLEISYSSLDELDGILSHIRDF